MKKFRKTLHKLLSIFYELNNKFKFVARQPGDLGMEMIAKEIIEVFKP